MVFRNVRVLFGGQRKSGVSIIRNLFLLSVLPDFDGSDAYRRRKDSKDQGTVPSLFSSYGIMADDFLNRRYPASFTIEASLVLSIVFFTLAAVIQRGYYLHDTVTRAMILEETLERVKYSQEGEAGKNRLEAEGETAGNPRLWLGEYSLEISGNAGGAEGQAKAGEWTQEIQMNSFDPGKSLRRAKVLLKMGKQGNEKTGGI